MNEATLRNLTDKELIRVINSGYNSDRFINPLVIELIKRLEQRISPPQGANNDFNAKRTQLLKRLETLTEAVNQLETDIEALEAA